MFSPSPDFEVRDPSITVSLNRKTRLKGANLLVLGTLGLKKRLLPGVWSPNQQEPRVKAVVHKGSILQKGELESDARS